MPDLVIPPEPATEALPQPRPTVDPAKLKALGAKLAEKFKRYESDRKIAEQRWTRNLRQFLGEYDPDVAKQIDPSRSKAYPRLTRVKVVSMVSRLMNLLFPTTEKNWGIAPSPVPNLTMEDLQLVLQQAQAGAQQAQKQLSDSVIEAAIRAFASKRCENLEREIEDQLAEVGGARSYPYVALARKVLYSGVLYGAGVLGGPFARTQLQRRWVNTPGGLPQAEQYTAFRPQFEFVPLWDYYPDMTARTFEQMDGQFRRMVLSKAQLRALADRPDFKAEAIKDYIYRNPKGNWKERQHESERRTMGAASNVNVITGDKFEVIAWNGYVDSNALKEVGVEFPEGFKGDMVDADVWMIDDTVIKADLSPWVELEPDQRVQQYHHFVFEEDDTNLLGNGLPNIMRDSQMGVAAATRMLMDNASVVCGPMLELNTDLLRPDQDRTTIHSHKIFYREGMGAEAAIPAVKNVQIDGHLAELQAVVQLHEHFADQETFVNPQTGGDMQKGPSEPFRTAMGASMIRGEASLPFKDVVRNFDNFTISLINALLLFNKHFNENGETRGDFTPIARGSSSLIAKELRGIALDMLSQSVQPEERKYIDWRKSIKEKLKVRDVDVSDVLVDDDEAERREQAEAEKQAQDTADMRRLFAAEVRKLLADASKSLTQADKNSAASETEFYNTILKGLESGVTPVDVEAARAGGRVPQAIASGFRRTSGADPAPAARNGSGAR